MAGGADVERVVGDCRSGGDALAERRVVGNDFRLVGASLEDGHLAIVERREIDVLLSPPTSNSYSPATAEPPSVLLG